jgi:hypothetical protein
LTNKLHILEQKSRQAATCRLKQLGFTIACLDMIGLTAQLQLLEIMGAKGQSAESTIEIILQSSWRLLK